MIISYPIMPGPTDEEKFSGYASETSGVYPASFDKRWHGGVHINAGENTIRAIADGTVVAYRQPTIPPSAEHEYITHPLGYMSTTSVKKWTHDGFVLLKHETETGENRPAVFYSLYMHLNELGGTFPASARGSVTCPTNMRVYRRDPLGKAGKIYGNAGMFHFEIFVTEADMRATGDARTAFSGLFDENQSDSEFWGNLYFKIPREYGCYDYSAETLTRLRDLGQTDPRSAGLHNSPLQEELFVKVAYSNGNRINTSFIEQPSYLAPRYQSTGQTTEAEYEYNILEKARRICPSCPSAGHDVARFSKVLEDTAEQAPEGSRLRDWQHIMGPQESEIICNFYSDFITKQSDADFPRWQGWTTLEEGNAGSEIYRDGICDIARLIQAVDIINPSDDPKENEGVLAPKPPAKRLAQPAYKEATQPNNSIFKNLQDLAILLPEKWEEAKHEFSNYARSIRKRLYEETLRKYLTYVVCKFPSEWSSADNAARYKRIKETYLDNKEDAYLDFLRHIQALQFWEDAGLGETNVWHFHPLRFIAHFRKCSWLSVDELTQMIPRELFSEDRNAVESNSFSLARGNAGDHYVPLNKAMRRYGITSPRRLAAFLANGIQETGYLQKFRETGARPEIGRWFGRGFLHLTWAENYVTYFHFRGRQELPDPDSVTVKKWQKEIGVPALVAQWRNAVEDDSYDCFDSAGFYWIWRGVRRGTDGHREADRIGDIDTQKQYRLQGKVVNFYYNSGFDRTARYINTGTPGSTGYYYGATERMSTYLYTRSVICDIEYVFKNGTIGYHPEYLFPTVRIFIPQRRR